MPLRRIIVANEQRLLREMLKRVLETPPDFQVVSEVKDLANLAVALETTNAHWVIISLQADGRLPELLQPLLLAHPQVHFLALTSDGSQVRLKSAGTPDRNLENPSLSELMALLRREWYPITSELDS